VIPAKKDKLNCRLSFLGRIWQYESDKANVVLNNHQFTVCGEDKHIQSREKNPQQTKSVPGPCKLM